MTGDLLTEPSQEPLASCDAAFSCLLRLRGQSGGNEVGAVHCRNVVNGETLSISRLIELAGDLGLKAEHARLDWQRLQALGFSHPLLALLKNTNVIVLTGGGRGGGSEVAVWDPLNPFGEILFVPCEDFERAWTGHTLIITTPPSNGVGTSPSLDFCWFTSAGLELLGKTSAGGQNPKPLVQKWEKAGTRLKPTTRRTPRQTDMAIAPAARGELDLARVELANEQRPADPAEGAQPSTQALPRPAAERRLSPPIRLCIAAGAILAAAGIGALLLRNSAADPVAAAVTLVKEVWAVAPNSAWTTDRRIASIPRTGSAPIPAAPSAMPTTLPDLAAPPATAADGHSLAAPPATPADGHSLAAPPITPADGHSLAAPPAIPADGRSLAAPLATPADGRSLATPADGRSLAAPPAIPADGHSLAAPPTTPADGHGLAAPPTTPADGHNPAAPSAEPPTAPAAPTDGRSLAVPAVTPADGRSLAVPAVTPANGRSLAVPAVTPANGRSLAAPPAISADGLNLAAPSAEPPTVPATPTDGRSLAAPAAEAPAPLVEHGARSLVAAPTAPPLEPDVAAPSAEPGLATPVKAPNAEITAPPLTTGPQLSAEDMGALLARGDTLLSVGDVVSARLFYERAVDAGGGLAAIRLGETFDPLFLDRVHLHGVRGDPGAALFWYRRARDLGAPDAEMLLKAFEAK